MSRPLWEAYIIEGLDNIPGLPEGSFAIYTKIHHALVDGAGGASFMSAIHDLEPDPNPVDDDPHKDDINIADKPPSAVAMRTKSYLNRCINSYRFARGFYKVGLDVATAAYKMARGNIPVPAIRGPKTRFNSAVGPYRVFEGALFDLDTIKAIKNQTNTKVNDVALAIISGAMRLYLQKHHEFPAESLVAGIPLDMRTRRGDDGENNQLGSVFTMLHTNIDDPKDRLVAIHNSANEAKQLGEESPLVDALQLAGAFSPRLSQWFIHSYIDNHLTERLPVNISTVVSNVPGPDFPLYCVGAKLVRYHGLGLLTPGVGIFHLVFSYCGTVSITVVGDRDIVPDPSYYKECMEQSFAELEKAILGNNKKKSAKNKGTDDNVYAVK
jgi:WS/DGAT/MGAT family acyltransferase